MKNCHCYNFVAKSENKLVNVATRIQLIISRGTSNNGDQCERYINSLFYTPNALGNDH